MQQACEDEEGGDGVGRCGSDGGETEEIKR